MNINRETVSPAAVFLSGFYGACRIPLLFISIVYFISYYCFTFMPSNPLRES